MEKQIVNLGKLNYELNKNDFSASVIRSPKAYGKVFIPKTIIFESQEYSVIKISENAFPINNKMVSINFPENSNVKTIESYSLQAYTLSKINIPQSIENLGECWCKNAHILTKISISPNNKYFKYKDEEKHLIFCKSDQNSDCFDSILFGDRNIRKLILPDYIKHIKPCAFENCQHLTKFIISESSQLQSIGSHSLGDTNIKSLYFPSGLEILDKYWCDYTYSLREIIISPNNKHFKHSDEDDRIILGKSNPNSDCFDEIVFANRNIFNVRIPNYIKRIRPCAFEHCEWLSEVEFQKDSQLEIIDDYSFSNTSIIKIKIPDSVCQIGKGVFNACRKLITFEITQKSKLQAISYGLFEGCDYLMNVKLFDTSFLKTIESYAFGSSGLRSIYITSNIEKIGDVWGGYHLENVTISKKNKWFTFLGNSQIIIGKSNPSSDCYDEIVFGCKDITNAFIPKYIKKIRSFAFGYCRKLKYVTFETNSELEIIDDFAFFYSSIEQIIIPRSVTYIGEKAFMECGNLKSFELEKNSKIESIPEKLFYQCYNLATVKILERCAFRKICKGIIGRKITELFIPETVEEFKDGWCKETYYLNHITISPNNKFVKKCKENNKIIVGRNNINSEIYDEIIIVERDIESIKIPKYIKRIRSNAFNYINFKKIEFEEDSQLQRIDSNAFKCSKITEIKIPKNVIHICSNSFSCCSQMKIFELEEGSKLTKIEDHLLYELESLTTIKLPNIASVQSIGGAAFLYSRISELYISSNIQYLNSNWSVYQKNLKKFVISPFNKFFQYADDDHKLILGKSSIDQDFYDQVVFACRDIKIAIIPKYVKCIKKNSFYYCKNIEKIEFSNDSNLEIIEKDAFSYSNIENIIIPKNVHKIASTAFTKCEKLKKFELSKGSKLLSIPHSLFNKCSSLREVIIPEESSLQTIENDAFSFTIVESIHIPSSIVLLEKDWCNKANQLNSVSVSPEQKNYKLINNDIVVSKSDPNQDCFDQLIFARRDIKILVIPKYIKYIQSHAFNFCKKLKKIDFAEDSELIKISKKAFNQSSLKQISIPKQFNTIPDKLIEIVNDFVCIEFLGDSITIRNFHFRSFTKINLLSFPNAKKINFMYDRWTNNNFSLFTRPFVEINPNIDELWYK